MIQFLINSKLVSVENEAADLTLLNYLRNDCSLNGTKEGCASGDCGACTVVVAEPCSGSQNNAAPKPLQYKAINSCVTFLSALHGKQILTVEGIKQGKDLHPVQQAMVSENATQCGFCTPGFVMSLFALYQQANEQSASSPVKRSEVINALSGNLCRCTGYQSIISAALRACNEKSEAINTLAEQAVATQLQSLQGTSEAGTEVLHLPSSRQALAQCMQQHPEAMLVAGSTDLALLHTQQLKALPSLISLSYLPELKSIAVNENTLSIGAACTLSDFEATLLEHFPSLEEIMERFASLPIRNQATLGGNIANASPIGDMAPVLIALNANIVLDNGAEYREMPLKEFFTGYKRTRLNTNEWLSRIEIPLLKPNEILAAYKISKRFEDDISAVCMAIKLSLENGSVVQVSTGYGGVAATPAYCDELHNALVGKAWQNQECVALGQAVLGKAFTPLDDVRASANYRIQMLENLWHRFWLESNAKQSQNSIDIRVQAHA